jgi:hypothetical protein
VLPLPKHNAKHIDGFVPLKTSRNPPPDRERRSRATPPPPLLPERLLVSMGVGQNLCLCKILHSGADSEQGAPLVAPLVMRSILAESA